MSQHDKLQPMFRQVQQKNNCCGSEQEHQHKTTQGGSNESGNGHHHAHNHGHRHSHGVADFGRAFLFGIILNASFVVAETIYGVVGNSIALLADAGHNLSDVLGLLLAWGASILIKRTPSKRFTYGLRSTSILAALISAVLLLVVTGGIAWEAVMRFGHPSHVKNLTVIVVAGFGVAVNLSSALLFIGGRKDDLNVRAAFMHMIGDATIALGVVVSGFIILYTGWQWLDPAVSLIISILVIIGTWGLLRDSVNLALHAVPEGIDPDKVRSYLTSVDGVSEVHDLHIWAMSTMETSLTVHLVMPVGYPGDAFRHTVSEALHTQFNIAHATIQIETNDSPKPCKLAPAEVV